MIPIKQKTKDDCFRACIASILEFNLEDIPDFNEEETRGWYDEEGNQVIGENTGIQFFNYLNRINGDYLSIFNLNIVPGKFPDENEFPRGYSIKSGEVISDGPAKGFYHALVAHNGRVVHDPSNMPNREYNFDNLYYMFTILDARIVKDFDYE